MDWPAEPLPSPGAPLAALDCSGVCVVPEKQQRGEESAPRRTSGGGGGCGNPKTEKKRAVHTHTHEQSLCGKTGNIGSRRRPEKLLLDGDVSENEDRQRVSRSSARSTAKMRVRRRAAQIESDRDKEGLLTDIHPMPNLCT